MDYLFILFVVTVEHFEDGLLGVEATQLRVASNHGRHALPLVVVDGLVALRGVDQGYTSTSLLSHIFFLELNAVAEHTMSQVFVEVEVDFLYRSHELA